jgi:hypothetical protein
MAVGKSAFNERVKRLANLFQSIATTSLGVGLLAPLAASLYAAPRFSVPWTGAIVWTAWGALWPGLAQRVLGRLRD